MFEFVHKPITIGKKQQASSWRVTRWWLGDRRSAVELSLLRLLSVAHSQRLELQPLIKNFADEHRGWARRRLLRLSRQLASGVPVVEALEQIPDLLPDQDLLSLRFATQAGTLSQAYDELISRGKARWTVAGDLVRQAVEYGVGMAIVFVLIVSFMVVFISPTFKYMFQDFGMNLPWALRSLLQVTDRVYGYFPQLLLLILPLTGLWWYLRPLRWLRRWQASRWFRSAAERQRAHLLRMLAQAAEAGRPVPSSLSTLARYHFDGGTRLKLLVARNELEQGGDAWNTLAQSQLLSPLEAQTLANTPAPALRIWIMRHLAQAKEEQADYGRGLLAMLVHPAIVLLFGFLVAWVAIAFFSVLVSMIGSLS